MPVITLSRQIGAGGETVAMQVAGQLRLRLMDRKFLNRVAVEAGLTEDALLELEAEGRRNLVSRLLASLRTVSTQPPALSEIEVDQPPSRPFSPLMTNPLGGIFSPPMPPASVGLSESVKLMGQVIKGLADEGDVLIMGGGAQIWLQDRPDVFHVLILAPLEKRVAWLQRRLNLSPKEALRRVRQSDRARADYLRRYHGADWLDPRLYDLVINRGRISESMAAELIVRSLNQAEFTWGTTPHLSGGDIPLSITAKEHLAHDTARLQHPDAPEGTV